MSWNNAKELKRFEEQEAEFVRICREHGMPEEKIQEIVEFDKEVFQSDRQFYRNTCSLEAAEENDGDRCGGSDCLIYHMADESVIIRDNSLSFDWKNEINDERLYNAILELNEEQQEILRLMVVEKKNQTEVADVLGITQPAISKKMKEIRKIVGKAMGKA